MPGDVDPLADLRPERRPVDLGGRRHIHIIGIGGAGMRAIARVLIGLGHEVSGSDGNDSLHLTALRELGATVHVGHRSDGLADPDIVTRSTAVPDSNPEVRAALEAGLAVHSRAEVLAAIAAERPALLVAGTHGKTTTSSMLSVLLDVAGQSPSFIIGSDVSYFGTGARWSSGDLSVIEADESDGTFLALPAAHAIVTSLDPDHLDYYGTAARLDAAFADFVDRVEGVTAVCIDDPDTAPLLDRAGVVTYGTDEAADVRITNLVIDRHGSHFALSWNGEMLGSVSVGLPGLHNALNATGAAAVALSIGVDFDAVVAGLGAFTGVGRRFEARGQIDDITFVDDYAHLPAEVEAAIATARHGWQRVIATYQPHRFSRTEALGATFAESFRGVDHLVLTDIYPSGESPRPGVTGRIVFDAVTKACPDLDVAWCPTLADVVDHLATTLRAGDLCLTLGAGDLTRVPDQIIRRIERDRSVEWLVALSPDLSATEVRLGGSVGELTTYRVGGPAAAIVEVGSRSDLAAIVEHAHGSGTDVLMVGRGSNLLVADRGFDGIAIVLVGEFAAIEIVGETVRAGAGVPLPVLARSTVRAGLTGFEWAVGVPGSVGGAVVMNAGGHGSDMAASIDSVVVLDLTTGSVTDWSLDDLALGYRTSRVGADHVVLEATLKLAPGDPTEGEAQLSEIVAWRRENQPGGQNAGSVFTNPDGDSAGRLIDSVGAKSMRVGSAEVSDKHANFIQVDPRGSADDVFALMREVHQLVEARTGVRLEAETRLVGFDDALLGHRA